MESKPLIEIHRLQHFLNGCCDQHETTAPTVQDYCDDLYQRVSEGKPVLLTELLTIDNLQENGVWEHPNGAANRIYKLKDRLGQDTTGDLGF